MSGEMTVGEARDLRDSWQIKMEAQRASVNTIKVYSDGIRLYLDWCDRLGRPPRLDTPDTLRAWMAALSAAGQAGTTMNTRLRALRNFAGFLVEEGIIRANGPMGVSQAAMDAKVPPALGPAQRDAIVAACAADKSFYGVRDAAMFSLMFTGLLRAEEAASMLRAGDVNLRDRTARVRRGKGGKERWTAFDAPTARLLDRYERHRRAHRCAQMPEYWLGKKGPLTYRGLYTTFKKRARLAGITAFPHMLRAGGAVEWRLAGGTTESLMTVAGWTSPKMVMHYTRAADVQIALAEAHRIHDR